MTDSRHNSWGFSGRSVQVTASAGSHLLSVVKKQIISGHTTNTRWSSGITVITAIECCSCASRLTSQLNTAQSRQQLLCSLLPCALTHSTTFHFL